jgi:hypothetical protein
MGKGVETFPRFVFYSAFICLKSATVHIKPIKNAYNSVTVEIWLWRRKRVFKIESVSVVSSNGYAVNITVVWLYFRKIEQGVLWCEQNRIQFGN